MVLNQPFKDRFNMLKKKTIQSKKGIQRTKTTQSQEDKSRLIDYLLQQQLLSNETLQLDEETTHALYEKTYQLYAAGQYAKAKTFFAFLLQFNPSNLQFLYGYATCSLMLKEYALAAGCFVQCGLLDNTNPLPYFYAADCYMHQQDLMSTCVALKMAVKRANDHPEYAEIKQRAQLTLDTLTSSQTCGKTAQKETNHSQATS
jgi:type III secretion system low calcium response chaperone LcrH/SycD